MAKISSNITQQRKERIHTLLKQYPYGLTEAEIVEALQLERRTTNNYLNDLAMQGIIDKDGQHWVISPYQKVLRKLEISPEEGFVLYLASRLLVKQTDRRNESAETALMKLAEILKDDAGVRTDLFSAAKQLAERPKAEGYEDIFRTILRAYLYQRQVKILYQPYRGEAFETIFSPYLLEPSAIGFTTYIIGHSSLVRKLRTYRMDRIRKAQLLRDEYQIPHDFPGLELLSHAWSIYYGDEVINVVLRFHPDVAHRVQETHWHPSQQLMDDPQKTNYLVVQFQVADTTDLTPWIRTWGANCEVLEPLELRQEMMGEARKLAQLYGWNEQVSDNERFDDIFGE
jgi:predicted DNA-binding transcriptional regulator YafY